MRGEGVFNKIIIALALAAYKMIIVYTRLVGYLPSRV